MAVRQDIKYVCPLRGKKALVVGQKLAVFISRPADHILWVAMSWNFVYRWKEHREKWGRTVFNSNILNVDQDLEQLMVGWSWTLCFCNHWGRINRLSLHEVKSQMKWRPPTKLPPYDHSVLRPGIRYNNFGERNRTFQTVSSVFPGLIWSIRAIYPLLFFGFFAPILVQGRRKSPKMAKYDQNMPKTGSTAIACRDGWN